MTTSTRQCIYCLKDKQFKRGSGSDFNSEHVVQKALIPGVQNTLTLVGRVCRECNQYFGDNHDIWLTKGAYEAVLRYTHGHKEKSKIDELKTKNLRFTTDYPDDSALGSASIDLINKDNELMYDPVDQICFRSKSTGKWVCFRQLEFESIVEAEHSDLEFSSFQIFGQNKDKFVEQLKKRWPNITIHGETPDHGPPKTFIEATYDPTILRALAKIGFNYMAKATEGLPAIAIHNSFNESRAYARYGVEPKYAVVSQQEQPILMLDSVTRRQTDGHLVTLECHQVRDAVHVISKVSLYNDLTWLVILSRDYTGPEFQDSGHVWDFENKICSALGKASNMVP